MPLFPGVFAIFGHGNVTCLSEALEAVKDTFPTWRGQNEQSMALAAIGFAKAKRRRQIMVADLVHRPRRPNMVTAAGVAHSNRLPRALLVGRHLCQPQAGPGHAAGRAFRKPDHQRQRCLQGRDPLLGSHRPPRATHLRPCRKPSRPCWTRPIAARPSSPCRKTCRRWPATIRQSSSNRPCMRFRVRGRPQARGRSDQTAQGGQAAVHHLPAAACAIPVRRKWLAKFAWNTAFRFARPSPAKAQSPMITRPMWGRLALLVQPPPMRLAAEADVILAIGTRLMDFTTGSWTLFNHDAKFISINAARWDATKHRALAVVGDATRDGRGTCRRPEGLEG